MFRRTVPTRPTRARPTIPRLATDSDVVVYRLTGAFFFGTASTVGAVLDRIGDRHKAFVLDFSAVPFVDSTAANVIAGIARKAAPARRARIRHRRHPGRAARPAGGRRAAAERPLSRGAIDDAVREAHAL